MTQATLVNLHPNEYSQEFHYYPLAVILDRCVGILILLMIYLMTYLCFPNKTEDLNLSVFNMITGINTSTTLTKHISDNADLMKENLIQIKGGIMINVDVSVNSVM